MGDLVERLRNIRQSPFREKHRATITQAANEIERLRAALETIRDDMLCDPKQVAEDALTQGLGK